MPCPERNMSTVVDLTGGDGEHEPVDMELTCTAPQDGTLLEQVTVSPSRPATGDLLTSSAMLESLYLGMFVCQKKTNKSLGTLGIKVYGEVWLVVLI